MINKIIIVKRLQNVVLSLEQKYIEFQDSLKMLVV